MRYEELNEDHIEDLVGLYIESFNAAPWHDEWTNETASNRLLQMMSGKGSYGLVAYEDDTAVGMILGNHEYYYNGMHFQIKEFCVANHLRGKGIGSQIVDTFLERLKEKKIDKVFLWTLKSNQTEGFYDKKGFEVLESMVMMGKDFK